MCGNGRRECIGLFPDRVKAICRGLMTPACRQAGKTLAFSKQGRPRTEPGRSPEDSGDRPDPDLALKANIWGQSWKWSVESRE